MLTVTTISQLSQHVGRSVTLQGWLYNTRSSGKLLFLLVRDGTGICQCVFEKTDANAERFEAARKLGQESSLEIDGLVRADERAEGGFELTVSDVRCIQNVQGYPITPKPHGIEFLMKHRHLWFRSKRQWAILRIRATVVDAIRTFFNSRGYVLIDTPIFAPSAGEGAQTLFEVDYFGEPMYLAQTGQLYLEAACMSHRKVYCFGPTFRAEKSKTRRHLTEFWMVEPEIAYADLDAVIAVAEEFVTEIVRRVLRDHRADLAALGRDLAVLDGIAGTAPQPGGGPPTSGPPTNGPPTSGPQPPSAASDGGSSSNAAEGGCSPSHKPFHRLTYSEAAELLRGPRARELLERDLVEHHAAIANLKKQIEEKEKEKSSPGVKQWKADKLAAEIIDHREELGEREEAVRNIPHHMQLAASFEWGGDLGGSDETIIARLHDRPVFVTHYPRQVKAFYMKRNEQDHRVVNNFDLLAPEGYGEIIGGSQREDSLEVLLERMREENLATEPYEWYLDLRRYGTVPHGGFGLGVERTVAWLCGLKHIRETIPFARMMGKVYP